MTNEAHLVIQSIHTGKARTHLAGPTQQHACGLSFMLLSEGFVSVAVHAYTLRVLMHGRSK